MADPFEEFVQVPDVHYPIGTLKELDEQGIKGQQLRAVHSCSQPTTENLGCQEWGKCPFQEKGVSGPITIAVRRIKRNGASYERTKPCHMFLATDYNAARAGERVQLIGTENDPGANYLFVGTRPLHVKPDPNCPGCAAKSCALYETIREERPIPKHPRPSMILVADETSRQILERAGGIPTSKDTLDFLKNNPAMKAAAGGDVLGALRGPRPRKLAPDSEGSGEAGGTGAQTQ